MPPNMQGDQDINGQEEINEPGTEGFTIDPDQVEKGIKDQMEPRQVKDLDRVLDEGNKLLFEKDSHYQLMDGLQNSQDIPGDLGNGAFGILMMLFKGGGYTMPTDIMDATGAILLARACAFLSQSGLVPVTDDDYEEAVHIFTVKLHSTLDPSFNERMNGAIGTGDQQQQQQQPMQQVPQQQPQTPGILNQGA